MALSRVASRSLTLDLTGHVVMLGYTPGRTERIIDEMLADGEREVVLGAWDEVDRHPHAVAHLIRQAHIVVALRDMEKAPRLRYVHDNVRCVQWVHPRPGLASEEFQLLFRDLATWRPPTRTG